MYRSLLHLARLAAFALLLAPLSVLAPSPARSQAPPRSIGDCERLKNDLAYNQCLAMFGPAARNVAGGFASADVASAPAIAAPVPQAEAAAEPASGSRGRYRGRRGRQSAVFTSGGGETRSYRRHRRRY